MLAEVSSVFCFGKRHKSGKMELLISISPLSVRGLQVRKAKFYD